MKAFEEAEFQLEGFTLSGAETVKGVYVCAQCEGGLEIIPSDFETPDGFFYVVCPDCGNVEQVGRISKTTVAIRNERAVFDYPKAIRALPEFWGNLIPTKEQRNQWIKDLGFR